MGVSLCRINLGKAQLGSRTTCGIQSSYQASFEFNLRNWPLESSSIFDWHSRLSTSIHPRCILLTLLAHPFQSARLPSADIVWARHRPLPLVSSSLLCWAIVEALLITRIPQLPSVTLIRTKNVAVSCYFLVRNQATGRLYQFKFFLSWFFLFLFSCLRGSGVSLCPILVGFPYLIVTTYQITIIVCVVRLTSPCCREDL